jgi:hypothetical protein
MLVPLETLAQEIRARIIKASTETRFDKARDFRISAGYCLTDAQKRIEAGEGGGVTFQQWVAQHIKKPWTDIVPFLGLISRPPAGPAWKPPTPLEAWTKYGWTTSAAGNHWREYNLWRIVIIRKTNGDWHFYIIFSETDKFWSPPYKTADAAKAVAFKALVQYRKSLADDAATQRKAS